MQNKIEIHKIYSSSEHNYFTREKFDIGKSADIEHEFIELTEGKGISGDRFEFSTYPITFMSLEVIEEVCKTLEIEQKLELFRRNVIISGVHLNSLIGEEFSIGEVSFRGLAHCAPCPWMNAVMKRGVYSAMRGRGGLRVEVVRGGSLSLGEHSLQTSATLERDVLQALKRMSIPS